MYSICITLYIFIPNPFFNQSFFYSVFQMPQPSFPPAGGFPPAGAFQPPPPQPAGGYPGAPMMNPVRFFPYLILLKKIKS